MQSQCSSYTVLVFSLNKSRKIWWNSRFRDTDPTPDNHIISWENIMEKEWFCIEFDLVRCYPCSGIHRLKVWAKNTLEILKSSVQNFSTMFSSHYSAETEEGVHHGTNQILCMSHWIDLPLTGRNEGASLWTRCKKLPCAAYCQLTSGTLWLISITPIRHF